MPASDPSLPLDRADYLDGYVEPHKSWRQWTAAAFTVLVLGGAFAGASLWVLSFMALPAEGDVTSGAPEALILGGQAPAAAATVEGRIVDLGCVLTGPIEVVADGTGAFIVTRGGPRVWCPQEAFHNGMNLRWPVESTPDTVPAEGGSGPIAAT